ncbi:MAG: sulfatase-like hydrolase/transferase [Myxococcota bacterium]|nr:sulfatase-like hydrolase/transferase [Myxococcota bacterium]
MRPAPLLLLVVLPLLAGPGCSVEEEPGPRDWNVVVLTLDTTRADALGVYGQPLPVTPRIDGMAREGLVFEQVASASPSTLPSHATLFTGKDPYAHGVRSNHGYQLSDQNLTLAEVLRDAGWRTGAHVAAPVLASGRRLDQGFGAYDEPSLPIAEFAERAQGGRGVRIDRPAEEITDAALAFLRQNAPYRFLLWVHYFDPHDPHDAPEPFASRVADPYLAEVSRVDHQVGLVLDEIEALGLEERTVVVLTADHGEGRGEHGEDTHAYFVYDTTMRVPLVFWGAGVPSGRRVPSLVRTLDVAPTLLDLLGLPPLPDARGVSLRPLFEDPSGDLGLLAYGESVEWLTTFGGDVLRTVREGRWKYVHKLEPALYDIEADPGERTNLARKHPEVVARLRGRLEELLRAAPEKPADAETALGAEEIAALEALGYVGGPAPEVLGGDEVATLELQGPDPVDRTADLGVFVEAVAWLERGDVNLAAAERRLGWLWERNPQSPRILEFYLHSLLGLERFDEALPLLRRALELDPQSVPARQDLARVLQARGESAEAERLLREAVGLDPCAEASWLRLSVLQRRQGRLAEGFGTLERGLAACAGSVVLRNALAFWLATSPVPEQRDGARAVRLAEGVVEESRGEHPDYLDTLAAAYAEQGDFDRAVATQRRALALVENRDLPPGLVEPLRRHLATLEAGQPVRTP